MNIVKTGKYYEITTKNFEYKSKIASFDLDDTIVTPKDKKDKKDKKNTFSKNSDDWRWMYDNIPNKLKELYEKDFCIIIISNQMGIEKGKVNGDDWIKKIENINKELQIEMKVFCSTGNNEYRKPISTFFTEFLSKNTKKVSSKSFYCGDACGRKDDFSDTDYKFALNCNLKFCTPEMLFLEEKEELPKIDYIFDFNEKKKFSLNFTPSQKEMLIMVGFQGSGKSFVSKYISEKYNYEIVNRDTEKTIPKCVKKATKLLGENKNLIIDNTNPNKESRKQWIDLAKQHNYNIRVLHMQTPMDLCKHNNIYRCITQNIDIIPDIAYNMYKSKFETPEQEEGIKEIIKVESSYPDDDKYYKYLM
jgi:bifunctional polynucleotide phosphatase/kinase